MYLIEPAGWSINGTLLVRAGRQVWATTDGRTIVTLLDDGPKFRPSDRIEPAGVLSTLTPKTPPVADGALRSVIFLGGNGSSAVRLQEQGGRLALNATGMLINSDDPIGLTRLRAIVASDGRTRLSFLGEQGPSKIQHAMPLVDYFSGRRIGTFGPRQIEVHQMPLAQVSEAIPKNAAILDATFTGASAAVLFETSDGTRQLLRLAGRNAPPSIHLVCGATRQRDLAHVRLETIALAPSSRDHLGPAAFLFRHVPRRRCVLLYYHGGPETSLKDYGYFAAHRKLKTANCDVLALEYSGSVGAGLALTRQIRRLGYQALQLDAASVKQWLSKQGYDHVAIVGVSYGGAPALAARKLLGPGARVHLVAPVMSLEPLRETDPNYRSNPLLDALHPERTPLRSVYPLFEQAFYGSSERARVFDHDLRQAYGALGSNDRVYLGRQDRKSPPSLLPSMTRKPQVRLYHGGHDVVSGMANLWLDITTDIANGASPASNSEEAPLEVGTRD